MKAHVPGNQKRNQILLFESKQNYYRNGGVPNSAGVYLSKTNVVMVPLSSLGVKKLSGSYTYDYKSDNSVLIHELVHQLTDHEYFLHGALGWFSEGLAEYCSVTPYRSGKFLSRSVKDDVRDYVTAFGKEGKGGRALGTEFPAPDLRAFMLQSYSSFTANANYNYGLGALITYYFFHMESDRRNITSFLKALKQGKTGEVALAELLNGRTFDELEQDIHKAWKSSGIKIHFQ